MAAGAQLIQHRGRNAALDFELPRSVGVIVEGAVGVVGVEARRLDGDLELLLKDDYVEQHVQHLLILAVAARRAHREKRLAVFAHDRWRERGARALSADKEVGARGIEVEGLHAVREGHAGVTGEEGPAEHPAGARGGAEEIALCVHGIDAGGITTALGIFRALGVRQVADRRWLHVWIKRERITRPVFQRRLRRDQFPALGGIRFREQPFQGHLRERGIAEERVAVVVGEFQGLVHGVDIVGRVQPHRFQVVAFEDVEGHEHHRALIPGPGLVDLEAVKQRRYRGLDGAVVVGEILVGEHATLGAVGLDDATRDVALVKGIAPGANGGAAVGIFLQGVPLGGDDRPQRSREIRLTENLTHLREPAARIVEMAPFVGFGLLAVARHIFAQQRIHGKAVGEGDGGRHDLFEAQGAEAFEHEGHRIQHRGNGRPERSVAVDLALRRKQRGRGGLWRGALAVDHVDLFRFRVVDHHRRFAAETEMRNLHDRGGEHRGYAGVDGVAALFQDARAGGNRVVPAGGDDPALAEDFGAHRLLPRRRPWRGRW